MLMRMLMVCLFVVPSYLAQAQAAPELPRLKEPGELKSATALLEEHGAAVLNKPDGRIEVFMHYEVEFEDEHFFEMIGTKNEPGPLRRLKKISTLSIFDAQITSKSLALVAELEGVEELILSGTNVDEQGMKEIAKMKGLKFLMPGRHVTDNGIKALCGNPSLEALDLQTCLLTDAVVEHLITLPSLNDLNLSNQSLTAAGIARLKEVKKLQHLTLQYAELEDADLAALSGIGSLKSLNLCFNDKLTGAGFAEVKGLDSLERLVIYQVPTQGRHLEHFVHFPKLKELWLHGITQRFTMWDCIVLAKSKSLRKLMVGESKLDAEAAEALRKENPEIQIVAAGE